MHYLLGDAGRIECSIGMLEDSFSKIAKGLLTKIEPVNKSLKEASEDKKPVIVSFPENRNMRSAYVMFSGFSKFPNENRKYDRKEYYIGEDGISTWLNYFINEYKTTRVIEKKYDANSLRISGKDIIELTYTH